MSKQTFKEFFQSNTLNASDGGIFCDMLAGSETNIIVRPKTPAKVTNTFQNGITTLNELSKGWTKATKSLTTNMLASIATMVAMSTIATAS